MTDPVSDLKCPRCHEQHELICCPYVKAVELEYGGDFHSIKRIEFLTPADFGTKTAGAVTEPDYPRAKPATLVKKD